MEELIAAANEIQGLKQQNADQQSAIDILEARLEACEQELQRYDALHTSVYWEKWQ